MFVSLWLILTSPRTFIRPNNSEARRGAVAKITRWRPDVIDRVNVREVFEDSSTVKGGLPLADGLLLETSLVR